MATLAELQTRLDLYKDAEIKVLEGNQSWSSPDGMTYTRANINALQRCISNLEAQIAILDGSDYMAEPFVFGGRR
ncbi:hypothetical protein [Desulforhopalus singaporensis]|uniref:GpW protein n=1 Tax=Desulforhopalus singaporensis TaxID=91360 RepID=A0A1H0UU23_9BACT|nr:hypothetical protein [Desulforhopalus singaporensis]SDP69601.1 hypothetical protein SAMN05660330_03711 [Desulforhopalus singaporensis]